MKVHRLSMASHHIREYRNCYGAVDANTGDSFFIMADECNCDCVSELRIQISVTYPDDYIILVMDNDV
ncbi:TPA: hypothetical protein ACGOZT_000147 [Streptococcus suis]